MKYFWFILSFTFCSIFLVQGQETRFTFQKVESDIIIGRFKDLAQDGEGILWLTSDNGLIRYNSKTADYYPNAFETNFTKGFIKGKSDNLLLVHDQGVGRIYSLEKHNLFGLNALGIDSLLHYPKTLFRSSNGTYWIGEDSTLVSYKNGNFHRYDMGFNWHSISYIRTFSMVEDGFGNLWSFSYYGKTYAFDRNMKEFNVVNTPKFREISWAKRKGLDKIWIGCSSGIYELIVNGKQQVANVRKVAEISSVSTFRFINKDQVLVGTWNDGVYFLEIDEGNTRLRKIDKVDFQDILQITPDEDEGYWILSSEQLGLLTKSPFHYIQVDPTNNMMRSVGKAGNDRMIVSNGITISILKKRKKNWEKVYSYVTRNHHFYRALYYDDKIAVGDNYGQVFFLDPKTNEFEKIDGVEKGGEIGWLFEDLEKRLWVCGNTNVGLYRVDNEKDVQTFSKPGLKNIYVIKSGPAGKIYAAGHNLGSILYEYDYNSDSFSAVQLEATPHGKEQFVTEDLYIARDTIFMATSHGFYSTVRDEANPWKIKKIDIPAFGNSTYLKAIERTGDGAFWLASETGLIRYYNGRVQFFDQSNGLPTRAIKFRGLQEDNFGNLWIATEKGLTMLPDNEGIASKTATPQIEIAKIGGGKHKQQKGETKPNHFRYGSNLEFNYLSHSFPQKFVNYQVRIPQLDTAWSKLNKETQLNFMNFDQGEYTLQVRAIAKGHQFSDVNQVSFSIGKPWFGSSWFYLAVIITLSLLTFTIWRLYRNRLEAYGVKIKREVNNRNLELNEEKNRNLSEKQRLIDQLNGKLEKDKSLHETEKSLLNTELKYRELNNSKVKGELELKKKQLTSQLLKNIQKDQTIKKLVKELNGAMKNAPEQVQDKLRKVVKMIDQNTSMEKDWDSFRLSFEEIHTGFNEKLKANFPELTPQDLRHCALIRANLSTQETATLLGISPESVKTSRYRLKKKLNLSQEQGLLDFLISI